jgi:hypothetical protein
MARRKNIKRIDPRYFLNETTHRDELEEQGSFTTNMPDDIPSTAQVMRQMSGEPEEEVESDWDKDNDPNEYYEERFDDDQSAQAVLSTDDLFKLFSAGMSAEDLRGVDRNSLTPEMKSILGHSDAEASTERDYRYDDSPYDGGY